MLRVWGVSGEELASLATEELSDVAALKLHLRHLHGFPICLQELLHCSTRLLDAMLLDAPLEVQLYLKASGGQKEVEEELRYAVGNGLAEAVRLLLKAGADKNVTAGDGITALMCACGSGHTEVARLLMEAGAHLDLKDADGQTALMFASAQGHVEAVPRHPLWELFCYFWFI